MIRFIFSFLLCLPATLLFGQSLSIDLTQPQPFFKDGKGIGWDFIDNRQTEKTLLLSQRKGVTYFSVAVPDGNYRVTLRVGSPQEASETQVRVESRRLLIEPLKLGKGQTRTFSFVINKRSPRINDHDSVHIKPREKGYLDWDDKLTFEFNGPAPRLTWLQIERDTTATTLYLCGNSTVVDQNTEPWASWGQMIPRWFNDRIAIANHAESGLTATSFLAQNRLKKILQTLKSGDYVFCEFGHNDQKEHGTGMGAWDNFTTNLKYFIDEVRVRHAHIIFVTPTRRRFFHEGKSQETHGDYPEAMRAVAQREQVPVIELHEKTRELLDTLGEEDSKQAFVHYPAGTFPHQVLPLADNTHFNCYGAYEISKLVVMEIKRLRLPIADCLRTDWHDFQTGKPDDARSFHLYESAFYDNQKPDGN